MRNRVSCHVVIPLIGFSKNKRAEDPSNLLCEELLLFDMPVISRNTAGNHAGWVDDHDETPMKCSSVKIHCETIIMDLNHDVNRQSKKFVSDGKRCVS